MLGKISTSFILLTSGLCSSLMANSLPDYSAIVEEVIPSVVTITTSISEQDSHPYFLSITNETAEQMPFILDTSLSNSGSGFVFSEDGYILTNAHVIQNAETISVQLHNGSRFQAELIGMDEITDIALLRIPANNLKPVVLSQKVSDIKVGQTVLGIGSPYSFEYSVTSGIISYLGRTLGGSGLESSAASYIQTDMLINPGNSGGPIVNGDGEVIGMSSRIFSTTGASIGISFAIPVNIIDQIVKRLIQAEGSLNKSFGMLTTSIKPEQIHNYGLQRNLGALVTLVYPDSPAYKSGLRPDDVIVTIGGNIVRSSEELQYQLSVLSMEEPVKVTVIRNGHYFATNLTYPALSEI